MAKVEPGTKLTENLRLVRKLGQGAMGEVWIAENLTLQSEVAVKLLQERLAESDERSARFVLEARAVAQIKSPHVVQIFDFGVTAEGTAFIVMELLAGQDLSERVKARGPLSTGDCVAVITQAASALAMRVARTACSSASTRPCARSAAAAVRSAATTGAWPYTGTTGAMAASRNKRSMLGIAGAAVFIAIDLLRRTALVVLPGAAL